MRSVVATAERALGARVADARPIAGGDINDALLLELADGRRVFVKTRAGAPPGEYAAEAAALRWLVEPAALPVPEVLAVVDPDDDRDPAPRLLALSWVDAGRPDAAGEEALGRGLAALHAAGAPAFGARAPGTPGGERAPLRIGAVTLPSDPAPDWPAFYADNRLRPLIAAAADRGALPDGAAARLERVCERMAELAGPPEPPAKLHGDLWSGNVHWDAGGRPWLIDPAAYGGQREIDLAMLRLFGGPSKRTYAAYDEALPLADGHADRVALYQLLPLLVHATLFGGGYGVAADRAARTYA